MSIEKGLKQLKAVIARPVGPRRSLLSKQEIASSLKQLLAMTPRAQVGIIPK
jgi:hypothetical protein